MDITRISRLYAHLTITATLHDGTPAAIAGVDVALLSVGATPTGDTDWTAATYADGDAVVLIAGPDADPSGGAIVVQTSGDLWARVTDNPEVHAAKISRITVR